MVARYKRYLGVSGWNPERKALGFFGHVTWQASGLLEMCQHQATQKEGKLRLAAQTAKSG